MATGTRVAGFASETAVVALSTAYAKMTCNGVDEASSSATSVPERVVLGAVALQLGTLAGGATTITWYVSEDLAGDHPITGVVTSTIVGQTAATGGVAESINVPWVVTEVAGTLYVWAKTNAGTANCTKAKISFRTPG